MLRQYSRCSGEILLIWRRRIAQRKDDNRSSYVHLYLIRQFVSMVSTTHRNLILCLYVSFYSFLELENLIVYTVPKTHTNNSIYPYNFYDSNIIQTKNMYLQALFPSVITHVTYQTFLPMILTCINQYGTTPHAVNQYARRFNHPESPAVNRAHASQITF